MKSSTLVADRVPVSAISSMEDRKRAIPHDSSDDPSPPLKRQAVAPSSSSQANHQMPQSQEDVIHFQKEAIYRQMLEYKRERNLLEKRVEALSSKATYHDDHIRVMDAWWDQLLDEVRLLMGSSEAGGKVYQNGGIDKFPSSLEFNDIAKFSEHLANKRNHIIAALSSLFKALKAGNNTSERVLASEWQKKLSEMLAAEKHYLATIERLEKEKAEVNSLLTEATYKYLNAEKKLERLKSQSLAKLERQLMSSSTADSKKDGSNAELSAKDQEINVKMVEGQLADIDQARKEAQAIASKQKEELQQLQAENARLSEQVTNMTIKLGRLSEEDIVTCDVYKNLKLKFDDLVVRYNHIEALNNNLREEAEKLQSERTAFKEQVLTEQHSVVAELQMQLAKTEQDLARIRATRDELNQELGLQRTKAEQKLNSLKELTELAEIRASRVVSLEAEVERLRVELSQTSVAVDAELAKLTREELLIKCDQFDKAYKALKQEVTPLEQAFKRAHENYNKKVKETTDTEAHIARLQAEKAKADQKYFAAMKSKETLQQENRVLKNQNSKSSEIIAQLKDAEKSVTHLMTNLEKQLAEMKNTQHNLINQNREQQKKATEQTNVAESLKIQVDQITTALKAKDTALSKEANARREAEIEVEKLQVRLEEVQRALEAERTKGTGNSQADALRALALCSVCKTRFKDTAIRACGHVFCKQCAEERITSRSRKCPNCGRAFAATDVISIYLSA